jgi:hypothetical protein
MMKKIEAKNKVRDYILTHLDEFKRGIPDELVHIYGLSYIDGRHFLEHFCNLRTFEPEIFSPEVFNQLSDYAKNNGASVWQLKDNYITKL